MLHVDGSRHAGWGPGRGQQDLIVIFDDANSEAYYAQLVPEESTLTVMAGLKTVVEQQGVFCSLYCRSRQPLCHPAGRSSRSSAEDPDWTSSGTTGHRTDRGLLAPGPGALRAAVWHLAGPAGGRTPSRQITTLDAANRFLASRWMGIHNRKFTVAGPAIGHGLCPLPGHGTGQDLLPPARAGRGQRQHRAI